MKSFVSIFAAAVIAGLGVYLLFEWQKAFGLIQNNVTVNITVFVLFIAALTLAAAALSAMFHCAIARADRGMVARLEQRLRTLEEQRQAPAIPSPSAPSQPRAPEPPSAGGEIG